MRAILLADVVGYSRLMGRNEDETHARLAQCIEQVFAPAVADHGGRLVRARGDGFLGEFDSTIDAVHCGLEIQHRLAEHEAGMEAADRLRLRIGINTGDVIVKDRDLYGHNINLASRLESLAEPGEVCVSRAVRDQLRGQSELAFVDQGLRQAQNIDQPIHVFRVVSRSQDEESPTPSRRLAIGRPLSRRRFAPAPRLIALLGVLAVAAAVLGLTLSRLWPGREGAEQVSLVVLPFRNLSGGRQEGYFTDAVTSDLTTAVSRLPRVFVIAPDTAFTYRDKTADAKEVGREIGVRYVLEGSIRRIGNKVETNAWLLDTSSGVFLWADRFDNDVTGLLELEDAITDRIAASLDIQLAKAESRRAEQAASPDAVDLRLRAVGLYMSGITPAHTREARALLERAVVLDPHSGEAWAWLADLLASDYLNAWNNTGKDQLDRAQAAVEQALAIDRDLPLAYYAAGMIHRARGEPHAAFDAFMLAAKFNPSFARAYAQAGAELTNLGRPAQAPPLVEKAIGLSPRDPSLGIFCWIAGRAYFFAGHYRKAVHWLTKSVELRSNLWYNWLYLVSAKALSGDPEDAGRLLRAFAAKPQFSGYTLARLVSIEQRNPSDNAIIVAGREKFHEGLREAGMAAK